MSDDRSHSLAPWLVAALALALFSWRAAPGVTFEDSGELAAATVTLGVPHPPGYPLSMLSGRVWLVLVSPFTDDAARALNLFSAACAAAAVGLLASFAVRVGARFGAAVATGLLLVTSTTFAAQAVVTEVYALAALLSVACLHTALTAPRPLFRSGLLLGLAMCAHLGSVLLAPLLFASVARARRAGRARLLALPAGIALGLLPYVWVPLAAARDPVVNIGRIDGWPRLAQHLLRVQYDTGLDLPLSRQLPFLVEQLVGQWPLVVLGGVLAFALLAKRVPRGLFAPIAVTLVVTGAGLLLTVGFPLDEPLVRWRLAGSFVPLVVLTAALLSLALIAIERALDGRLPALGLALALPLATVLLALPFGPTTLATAVDQRGATWAEDYGREVLGACPPDAVLVVSASGYSDVLYFPLLYLQVVRDVRPDVFVLNRDLLPHEWFREELAERRPELAAACARLERAFAESQAATPRDVRIVTTSFFPEVHALGRPVAFVTRPSPRLTAGRSVVPGPVLWHAGDVEVSPAPPAARWLPEHDPDPWVAELRRRTRERDLARAALLEERGDGPAAAPLRTRWR